MIDDDREDNGGAKPLSQARPPPRPLPIQDRQGKSTAEGGQRRDDHEGMKGTNTIWTFAGTIFFRSL